MFEVSKIVEDFIRRFIHSVYELEILMMLRDDPSREWGALAASQALLIEQGAVAASLRQLQNAGLLARRTLDDEDLYQYKPASPELERTGNELAHAYTNYRVKVIHMIASQPTDKVRTFADAFKLRKEDEE